MQVVKPRPKSNMPNFKCLLSLLGGCLLCFGQTVMATDIEKAIPLEEGISFLEWDDTGHQYDLSNMTDIYKVDVNSVIFIRLNSAKLISSFPLNPNSRVNVSPIPTDVARQRTALLDLLQTLNEYISISSQISSLFVAYPDDAEIPGLAKLKTKHGSAYIKLQDSTLAYLEAVNGGHLTQDIEGQRDNLFAGELRVRNAKLRDFIQGELQRLDGDSTHYLENLMNNAEPVGFRLKAYLIQNGARIAPVHLPGYDSYEDGDYKPIEKISFNMSSEETKNLQTELEFNKGLASSLNETKDLRENVASAVRQVLGDGAKRVEAFQIELQATINDVTSTANAAVATTVSSDQSWVEDAKSQLIAKQLNEGKKVIVASLHTLQNFKNALGQGFSASAKLSELATAKDPVEALGKSLSIISALPQSLKLNCTQMEEQFESLNSSFTAIAAELRTNVDVAPSAIRLQIRSNVEAEEKAMQEIKDRIKNFKESQITPLIQYVAELQNNLPVFRDKAVSAWELSKGFSANLLQDKSILVAANTVTDTKINIPRSGRNEGDQIELRITAHKANSVDSTIIAERVILFNLDKFGVYSQMSTGAAAFFNAGSSNTSEFGAVASWILHDKSRNKPTWNVLNPGIGVHAAGISTGLGLGLSLNLLPGNLLQVGGGNTMRSTGNNRWYWFVGLRLANFKMPGASSAP